MSQYSVLNATQVHDNVNNTSTSKQLYSFPKTSRFQRDKGKADVPYSTLPSQLSKRGAGFGYGNKSNFTQNVEKTPAPSEYFKDKKDNKNGGKSFGESRGKMQEGGIFKQHLKTPGPGQYEKSSTLSKIKYTVRPRTANPQSFSTADKNPGPGAYDKYETIKAKGNLNISKYKSSGCTIINPQTSKRFKNDYGNFNKVENHVPGPAMNSNGVYQQSQFHNSMCRTFGRAVGKGLVNNNGVPGVGSYQMPSDFGIYRGRQFTQQKNKSYQI